MSEKEADPSVLEHIQRLADEEHRLYGQATRTDDDSRRLGTIRVELDQCWDLLRRRRALREVGENPDQARVRSADVVENYEG